MNFRLLLSSLAVAILVVFRTAQPAFAGLDGQPAPSAETSAKIRSEALDILKGNISTGRPNLFLLIQNNASADVTPLLTRVVGDDTTYAGLTDTLDDAATGAKTDPTRQYILYNLARVHLLRSRFLKSSAARRGPLTAAADATAKFDRDLRDPTAWELKGDIDSELGDLTAALAAYKQMTACGSAPALVHYKYGSAYEKANRLPVAETEYHAAQLAQGTTGAGGSRLRHLIFQGLARIALHQGSERDALSLLAQSARVDQDPDNPFRFDLGVANDLLRRGYAAAVLTYAQAALRASPDDEDARDLVERAQAAKTRER